MYAYSTYCVPADYWYAVNGFSSFPLQFELQKGNVDNNKGEAKVKFLKCLLAFAGFFLPVLRVPTIASLELFAVFKFIEFSVHFLWCLPQTGTKYDHKNSANNLKVD